MIRIIADSTCDLSKEIVNKYNIKIITTKAIIEGQELNDYDYDGESLNEFYKTLGDIKSTPGYKPPTSEEYLSMIEDGVFNGVSDFIIFVPSSHIIRDYVPAVEEAKETFEANNRVQDIRIHLVDTANGSLGFGYSVLKAAMMREEGASFEEIVDYCEASKLKIRDLIAIPDMDFLVDIGGVTRASAKASQLLGVTPVLSLDSRGKASLASKAIGNNKVVQYFVNDFAKHVDFENTKFVLIGYTTNLEKAKELRQLLFKETKFPGEIHIIQVRPAFGSHVGREAVTLYYYGKQNTLSIFNFFKRA